MKTNFIIQLFLFFLICGSCKSKKEQEIKYDYLTGFEWIIEKKDTLNNYKYEILFFTEDKFFRFSNNSKYYLIDSSLRWEKRYILNKNNKNKYEIRIIDSNSIEFLISSKKYIARKRNRYHANDINDWFQRNSLKVLINGKWKLDSLDIFKTRLPGNCDNLKEGTIFEFQNTGELAIYPNRVNEICDTYNYYIDDREIILSLNDMVFRFPISKLTEKKLILVSKFIPEGNWDVDLWSKRKAGFNLFLSKIE